MVDRPIIFSAPMVRALIEGRKTQTRRVIKGVGHDNCLTLRKATKTRSGLSTHVMDAAEHGLLPFAVGDRLWVRETCCAVETRDGLDAVRYAADQAWVVVANTEEAASRWVDLYNYRKVRGATVPPIHAPKWISRLTLIVTDVRVQLLHDITEADAVAEGVAYYDGPPAGPLDDFQRHYVDLGNGECATGWTAAEAFADLWTHINGPSSWAENPWVVAVTFDVLRRNIDEAPPCAA